MSVEKKQSEVKTTFTSGNRFLHLTERKGSKPAVNLNDYGNDIRSVRVDEIAGLIELLQAVQEHLEPEDSLGIDVEIPPKYPKRSPLPSVVKRRYPMITDSERWLVAEEICRAWVIPGVSEEFHERAKGNLRVHWPVLAKAIEKFVEVRPHDAG